MDETAKIYFHVETVTRKIGLRLIGSKYNAKLGKDFAFRRRCFGSSLFADLVCATDNRLRTKPRRRVLTF